MASVVVVLCEGQQTSSVTLLCGRQKAVAALFRGRRTSAAMVSAVLFGGRHTSAAMVAASSSNCSPPSRVSFLRLYVGVMDSRKGDSSNLKIRL